MKDVFDIIGIAPPGEEDFTNIQYDDEIKLNTGPIGVNGQGCLGPILLAFGLGGIIEFFTGIFGKILSFLF